MRTFIKFTAAFFMVFVVLSCVEIPDTGSIAPDIKYKNRKQFAISGMQQTIGQFETSSSTLPVKFKIVKITETENKEVSSLSEEIPVVRYTKLLVGGESPEELALITETELLPAVSVNEYTGQIEIQKGNNIPAGEYHFDIEVANTSGSRVMEDAIIIEFNEFEIASWSRNMAQEPVIERIGDSPNHILFVGYLNGEALPGNRIDFTKNRSEGFNGTFVDDTAEGEIWKVNFPVNYSNTHCTWKIIENTDEVEVTSYVSENFNFVLGRPGNYVIKLYK